MYFSVSVSNVKQMLLFPHYAVKLLLVVVLSEKNNNNNNKPSRVKINEGNKQGEHMQDNLMHVRFLGNLERNIYS